MRKRINKVICVIVILGMMQVFADCPLSLYLAQSGEYTEFTGICSNQNSISVRLPLRLKAETVDGLWYMVSGGTSGEKEVLLDSGECFFMHSYTEVGFSVALKTYAPVQYVASNLLRQCDSLSLKSKKRK